MSGSFRLFSRTPVRRRAAVRAAVFLSLASSLPAALAEQPGWRNFARSLAAIRLHCGWFYPNRDGTPTEPADRSGLWLLDAVSGDLTYLRPRAWNEQPCEHPDYLPGSSAQGQGLTSLGDRVVIESWPAFTEVEIGSWRMLRRYPPWAPRLKAYGWTLVGPAIDAALAAELGLAPGVYGFAQCEYPYLNPGWNPAWPPKQCEPLQLEGGALDQAQSRGAIVRRDGVEGPAGGRGQVTVPEAPQLRGLQPTLPTVTLDPLRRGLWVGNGRELRFLAASDGQLVDSGLSLQLPEEILQGEGAGVRVASYLPALDSVLAEVVDRTGSWLVRVPPDGGDPTVLEHVENQYGRFVAMTALPQRLPQTYTQTIPIVARTTGRRGTDWTSDLWLFNPSSEATRVTLSRLGRPEVEKVVALPGHGSVRVDDVLTWLGGGPSGDGVRHDALVVESPYRWGENVVAVARVWTPDPDPELRARGGTMGQAVPAVPGRVGYSNHLAYEPYATYPGEGPLPYQGDVYADQTPEVFDAELELDEREPGRYRHNVGIVNPWDEELEVRLYRFVRPWQPVPPDPTVAVDWDALVPGYRQVVRVAPRSVAVVNLESLFPASVRATLPPVVRVEADREAIVWLSMVDNVTGDATFVPYTVWAEWGDTRTRYAIPVVAHNPGRNGTVWRTDVYGLIPPDLMWFRPAGGVASCPGEGDGLGEVPAEVIPPWEPGLDSAWCDLVESLGGICFGAPRLFPDVVRLIPPCAGAESVRGALEVWTGSWMAAYSRTYTTRADGGTYGGMLPLYPPRGWPVQHFAGIEVGERFRVNVGLYNGDAEHAITHRLTLYAADGAKVAEREITLAPWASVLEPLERILGLAAGSLQPGTYGLTVLPLDDPEHGVEGRSWAYVSLVDNVTGDPTNWW